MDNTSPEFQQVVDDKYRLMTPEDRVLAASSMLEAARKKIESSLPEGLTAVERKVMIARRMYAGELPEAAFRAYADWLTSHPQECA